MSPREELQNDIVKALTDSGKFNAPYGIQAELPPGKKYRSIIFGIARILDAEIRIYSPNFLLLRWDTAIRSVPKSGKEKYEHVDELMKDIRDKFL